MSLSALGPAEVVDYDRSWDEHFVGYAPRISGVLGVVLSLHKHTNGV